MRFGITLGGVAFSIWSLPSATTGDVLRFISSHEAEPGAPHEPPPRAVGSDAPGLSDAGFAASARSRRRSVSFHVRLIYESDPSHFDTVVPSVVFLLQIRELDFSTSG